jgi:ubiquinone/menaquinone biosynthesis C-methylase UbiE
MTAATRDPDTQYAFNNDEPTAGDLLDALGQMLDEFSTKRLLAAGVREGARCLEVGAGRGTIAGWLGDQVGPTGTVVATDIKPQHVRPHPRVEVVQHNVVTDPLPEGPFDIIHARAVLQHLPERNEVLAKLAAVLAPGGSIVVEELETGWSRSVLATPDPRAHEIFASYEETLSNVLRASGNDPTWCRRVHQAMRDTGLTDVDTEAWQRSWIGGTGVCLLAFSGSTQLNDKLVAAGMAADDLETLRRLALDPRLTLRGMLLLSTTGRKPR